MAVRALVFDFDGVVVDTEGPEYEAWRATWEDYGHELTLDEWVQCIGTNDPDGWSPLRELSARVGAGFDPVEANERRRARHHPAIAALTTPLPGVVELLTEAKACGLRTAIASSSGDDWVPVLLEQLGLVDHFEHLSLFDGTCPAKPSPDLYLRACEALGVDPSEAVAIEDSPNGIAAAKAAGLWCVAVPHAITRRLDLSAADVVLDSLDGVSLHTLRASLGC
ncbi:MAG TPA: HAD-IA family hydrolase [Acidimicrobiales bacterium]|nr:HAD-IA family hydrolase [Acidimicrobiales bacterium]